MRGIQVLEIHISMDFSDGHIIDNYHINPLLLKARAFIREAVNMIWTFGTATRFTKFEVGGCGAEGFRMEATNAWKACSSLVRESRGRVGMRPAMKGSVLAAGATCNDHVQASTLANFLRTLCFKKHVNHVYNF